MTVNSEMFVRALFLLIFANLLWQFKVLANKKISISIIDYPSSYLQNQELAVNSELEKWRNINHTKITELTVYGKKHFKNFLNLWTNFNKT